MNNPLEDQIESVNELLTDLAHQFSETGGWEPGRVCVFDGYPTTLACTCGHGHDRHVGKGDDTRCMSYYQHPDCACTAFFPDPKAVSDLWEHHRDLLAAIDFDKIVALIPVAKMSQYVHEWPQDEQDLFRDPAWPSFTERSKALDLYRRQKATLAIIKALVGAP